jgi:hypothetical protein
VASVHHDQPIAGLDANEASCPSSRFFARPVLHLLLAAGALAAIWLLLLPALLHLAPIRRHVDHLEARQIDASAMYYTELDPGFLIDGRRTGLQPVRLSQQPKDRKPQAGRR